MKKNIKVRKMVLCAIFAAEDPGKATAELLELSKETVEPWISSMPSLIWTVP